MAETSPASVEAFHRQLAERLEGLPRRLRQCADHISAHADRIAVSTVAEMAAGAGVPPSALMRFCRIMGFAGYSDMQRLFRQHMAPGLPDYATRLRALHDAGADTPGATLARFVEAGRVSLDALAESVEPQALDRAVAVLSRAGLVHVMGLRRAFAVASYLAHVFGNLQVPAVLHDGVGRLDPRSALRPGDAVLAISFAPYSEEIVALSREARARGLSVVAITDLPSSPLAQGADAVLIVPEADFGAFRSLSATVTLALALAVAVGSARGMQNPLP